MSELLLEWEEEATVNSTEPKINALETETQLKINRQFLKRIEALEKFNKGQTEEIQALKERVVKVEERGSKWALEKSKLTFKKN